jgi:aspartate--ammonia ligase
MYIQILTQKEIQKAIKVIKVFYETEIAKRLNLTRVSAPLFVTKESGMNDNLNEVERPVGFDALDMPEKGTIEIVQSLAKWKRYALKKYDFHPGEGLYTNMNAIRRDEVLDETHSMYVDQWDFEKIITEDQRTIDYLKSQVEIIYSIFKDIEQVLARTYPHLHVTLPKEIFFITSEELLQRYPDKTPKERERLITKEKTAVFLFNIGNKLSDGTIHDGRAADYDDWSLNGDLLFYNAVLDDAIELSSMGIRVDKETLLKQLKEKNQMYKTKFEFHQMLLNDELPLTFGGGIGQSRMCQFLLRTYHIGEVQCSIWPDRILKDMKERNIKLL